MAALPLLFPLPEQINRRASTAQFIVQLEAYFSLKIMENHRKAFAALPVPPDYLDRSAVQDCRSIAAMLALARRKIYKVTWDAEDYANDAPKTALPNPDTEARLMAKYRPLISHEDMVRYHGKNLPVIVGPAIITDVKGRILVWSLPKIIPEGRQEKILMVTRILKAQFSVDNVDLTAPPTTAWRTAHTFYSKGFQWTSGSTLLSPAGFQIGHSGPGFDPAPSVDARSTRAQEWMRAFEESGGMLDGILAVTHPALYQSSQDLMQTMWRDYGVCRPILALWPSCFTSLQLIANRSTIGHRDMKAKPGWFDLLLTLGSYGKRAVLELPGLGVSLPYDSGTVVPVSSKLLIHGVPEVYGDRVCYAFYMHSDLYKRFEVPMAGMASVVGAFRTADLLEGEGAHGTGSGDTEAAFRRMAGLRVNAGAAASGISAAPLRKVPAASVVLSAHDEGESEVGDRETGGEDAEMGEAETDN